MDIVALDYRHHRWSRSDAARGAAEGPGATVPVERVVEGEVLGGGTDSDSAASWRQYRHAREALNAVPDLETRRGLAAYLATAVIPGRSGLIDVYV